MRNGLDNSLHKIGLKNHIDHKNSFLSENNHGHDFMRQNTDLQKEMAQVKCTANFCMKEINF